MRYLSRTALLLILSISFSGCIKKENHHAHMPEFNKPADATARIEGQKFPYCLWYNPKKWMIWETPFLSKKEGSEWNLVLLNPDERISIGKNTKVKAEATFYPFKDKNLSKAEFKALIQNRIINAGQLESFEDLSSGERIVNNLKVFSWNFKFKDKKAESITAYIYFYSDYEGSVAVVVFAPSKNWEENKEAIHNLLNGFCLLQSNN